MYCQVSSNQGGRAPQLVTPRHRRAPLTRRHDPYCTVWPGPRAPHRRQRGRLSDTKVFSLPLRIARIRRIGFRQLIPSWGGTTALRGVGVGRDVRVTSTCAFETPTDRGDPSQFRSFFRTFRNPFRMVSQQFRAVSRYRLARFATVSRTFRARFACAFARFLSHTFACVSPIFASVKV